MEQKINWVTNLNELHLNHEQVNNIELFTAFSLTQYLEKDHKEVKAQIINLGKVNLTQINFEQKIIPPPYTQREIFLYADKSPKLWAESFCSSSSSFWSKFLTCGETPLGKFLFSDEFAIVRSAIRYALINEQQAPKCLLSYFDAEMATLIARHSYFYLDQEALSLVEIFLI